jgi:hypothetical protein
VDQHTLKGKGEYEKMGKRSMTRKSRNRRRMRERGLTDKEDEREKG